MKLMVVNILNTEWEDRADIRISGAPTIPTAAHVEHVYTEFEYTHSTSCTAFAAKVEISPAS
jgi:hypothetical protein